MGRPGAQPRQQRRGQQGQQRRGGLQELRAQAARDLEGVTANSSPLFRQIQSQRSQKVRVNGEISCRAITRGRLFASQALADLDPARKPFRPKRSPGSGGATAECLGQGERKGGQTVAGGQDSLAWPGA